MTTAVTDSDVQVENTPAVTLWCVQCRRAFEPGDVVSRERLPGWALDELGAGTRGFGGLVGFCHDCRAPRRPWGEPVPCAGGCGLLVTSPYDDRYFHNRPRGERLVPGVTVCGGVRCADRAYNARRRKSAPTSCAGCGETFTPKRSDARYCSAACKQRAYRRRNGGSS
jgi:hypothetical protein